MGAPTIIFAEMWLVARLSWHWKRWSVWTASGLYTGELEGGEEGETERVRVTGPEGAGQREERCGLPTLRLTSTRIDVSNRTAEIEQVRNTRPNMIIHVMSMPTYIHMFYMYITK